MFAPSATRSDAERAVDTVELLIEAHGVGITPPLRALIRQHDGNLARAHVLLALGYIPANPEAWVRAKVADREFDGGAAVDLDPWAASCYAAQD